MERALRLRGQEERRRHSIDLQRKRRREAASKFREDRGCCASGGGHHVEKVQEVGAAAFQGHGVETTDQAKGRAVHRSDQQRRRNEARFAALPQVAEWMVEVPADLGPAHWLVLARPEGHKCLVISENGETIARKKNGRVLSRFQSALPGGRRGLGQKQHSLQCVLECVFHESDGTFYVVDLLYWKGQSMLDCEASFRFAWCHSKLQEYPELTSTTTKAGTGHVQFRPLACFECSRQGLEQAYRSEFPFSKDGLLFYHKEGHYASGELTPLVLSWKDAATSKYPIDSPDGIRPFPIQSCVLRTGNAPGQLCALGGDRVDVAELVLGCDSSGQAVTKPVLPGAVTRFHIFGKLFIDQAGEDSTMGEEDHEALQADCQDVRIRIEKLVYQSDCPSSRAPDSSCKIAYQYAMRHRPLLIESLFNRIPM